MALDECPEWNKVLRIQFIGSGGSGWHFGSAVFRSEIVYLY